MAIVKTDSQHYIDIANAIREKNGSTDLYTPSEMASVISTIEGESEYQLIIKIESGSTVTAEKDGVIKTANESNGIWCFKDLDAGDWTINCMLDDLTTDITVTIVDGEPCQIFTLDYFLTVADFDLTSYGTLGTDYEVVYDDDTDIPQELWSTERNWKIRFLTSGTVTALKAGKIDVFCVGAGGGSNDKGGGGGGYTTTVKGKTIGADDYYIGIGSGAKSNNGGSTSAFSVDASGGKVTTNNSHTGGSGGSGGGGGGSYGTGATKAGAGGSDGSKGSAGAYSGGSGQGTTTREFGESGARLYAGGGGGGNSNGGTVASGGSGGGGNGSLGSGYNGTANTGGGGGGGSATGGAATGGSGIVIIRNARG